MNRIPITEELNHMGISIENQICQLYGKCNESVKHLMVECDFSKEVYYWIMRWCGFLSKVIDFVAPGGNYPRKKEITKMILYSTLWNIWLTRNDKVFNKMGVNLAKTVDSIVAQSLEFIKYKGTEAQDGWIEVVLIL
ncbi:uncharacterized protein LOC111903293 [Lactuca sativa]|uniref:uncharacterized protein LOC111903293 n=1 Tax=Lactuca sativa TaxID=4236 RepID=UPI000CD8A34C|nr:uncharacterized protein LOC111903293 [Lactuca sativa]